MWDKKDQVYSEQINQLLIQVSYLQSSTNVVKIGSKHKRREYLKRRSPVKLLKNRGAEIDLIKMTR
jgi:hypothetical protein